MRNLGNNDVAATLQVICVLFDLETRQSVAMSDELKELASKHLSAD
jgi:acyl-CoA thioesterase FadM